MAKKLWSKGNISFMPVVESINRKFALRREVSGNKRVGKKLIGGAKFMGAGTRTSYVIGFGNVSKNYFWMRKYGRGTIITSDETLRRSNFSQASKWASTAMKDLSVLTQNQLKWKQLAADTTLTCGGISAAGYSTMRQFMFAYAYKVVTDSGSVPDTHALPAID